MLHFILKHTINILQEIITCIKTTKQAKIFLFQDTLVQSFNMTNTTSEDCLACEEFLNKVVHALGAAVLEYVDFLFEIIDKKLSEPSRDANLYKRKFDEVRLELFQLADFHKPVIRLNRISLQNENGAVYASFSFGDFDSVDTFLDYEALQDFNKKRKNRLVELHTSCTFLLETGKVTKIIEKLFNKPLASISAEDLDISRCRFFNAHKWNNTKLSYAELKNRVSRRIEDLKNKSVSAGSIKELSFTFNETTKRPVLEYQCSVCQDGFEIGQKLIGLPCDHVFHKECIEPWFKKPQSHLLDSRYETLLENNAEYSLQFPGHELDANETISGDDVGNPISSANQSQDYDGIPDDDDVAADNHVEKDIQTSVEMNDLQDCDDNAEGRMSIFEQMSRSSGFEDTFTDETEEHHEGNTTCSPLLQDRNNFEIVSPDNGENNLSADMLNLDSGTEADYSTEMDYFLYPDAQGDSGDLLGIRGYNSEEFYLSYTPEDPDGGEPRRFEINIFSQPDKVKCTCPNCRHICS